MPNSPSGELWGEQLQIGKEATYGVAVPATRRAYARDVTLTKEREGRTHRFATGDRQNARAHTTGPTQAGGGLTIPVSATELIEFLLVTVKGGVTPTVPSGGTLANQWSFKPSTSLDSMTIERDDGARVRRSFGVRGASMSISGNVREANEATFELFASDNVDLASLTGALGERTPEFYEGWETKFYIDAFGSTPRTTRIPGTLINWDISFNNNLARKYMADNTKRAQKVTTGELEIEATLLFEATSSFVTTQLSNWDADTLVVVGLEFGDNLPIDAGTNEVQTVTITGSPTGGTFTLTYQNATTSAIAYNATAAVVQAALESLVTIDAGNVAVAGGPGPATPYTVTFQNRLGGKNVVQMTAAHTFTGGTTPNIAVTTTTPGVGYKSMIALEIPGAWDAVDFNGDDEGTRVYEFTLAPIYDPALAAMFHILCQNNRTSAF